jgi:hypothetical protein
MILSVIHHRQNPLDSNRSEFKLSSRIELMYYCIGTRYCDSVRASEAAKHTRGREGDVRRIYTVMKAATRSADRDDDARCGN